MDIQIVKTPKEGTMIPFVGGPLAGHSLHIVEDVSGVVRTDLRIITQVRDLKRGSVLIAESSSDYSLKDGKFVLVGSGP
jgi:hypothetical protein